MKKIILIYIALLLAISSAFAQQYYSPNPLSYYSGSISDYWPSYGKEECTARQDFIVQILPGGCSPAVVRSDLLEEQNVPVFCQLTGIKINPLINVPEITSITFKGKDIPKDIGGIGFHPARAALKTWGNEILGSPIVNNLGYLVVMLKRQPVEKNMSDWVEAELTAVIQYKAEKAFGVGKTSFVSTELSEEEWHQYYNQYGFWKGKGYVRVREIGSDDKGEFARVDIYLDENRQLTSLLLREGQTYPQDIYLPGYYCQAALKVTLQSVSSEPKPKVKLDINGEEIWVQEGQRIIDDKCSVAKIEQDIYGSGEAEIRCPDGLHKLSLNPAKARLVFESNGNEIDKVFSIKEELSANTGIVVGFIGDTGKAKSSAIKQLEKQFIVLAKPNPSKGTTLALNDLYYQTITYKTRKLIEGDKFKGFGTFSEQNFILTISSLLGAKNPTDIKEEIDPSNEFKKELEDKLKTQFGGKIEFKVFLAGDKTGSIKFSDGTELKNFRFEGLESSYDKEYKSDVGEVMENYYKNAIEEYRKIQINYGSEKKQVVEGSTEEPYGAQALSKAAELAGYLKKFKTQAELFTELIEKYPETNLADDAKIKLQSLKSNDMSNAIATVFIEGDAYNIILEEVKDVSLDEKSVKLLVDTQEGRYTVGDIIKETITIKEIKEDSIELESGGFSLTKPLIKKGETAVVGYRKTENGVTTSGSVTLRVLEINLKKEATIILTPLVERTETQTNFTFKIGIEKRALKLSPEKTKELVNELDNTITQWGKITNDLGNLVKAWKGTCFAGSAFLWAKSFFDNLGGGSIARKEVMRGAGGWWEKCGQLVADKQYDDVHKCLAAKNAEIEKEIGILKSHIDEVNKGISDTTKTTSGGTLGLGKNIQTEDSRKAYAKSLTEKYSDVGTKLGELGKDENKLTSDDINKITQNLDNSSAFYSDLREMDLWINVYNDPQATDELKQRAKNNLYSIMSPMKKTIELKQEEEKTLKDLPPEIAKIYQDRIGTQVTQVGTSVEAQTKKIYKEDKQLIIEGKTDMQAPSGYSAIISTNLGYLYVMGDKSQGNLLSNNAYHWEGVDADGNVKLRPLTAEEQKLTAGGFKISEGGKCNYLYKNPEVKYHEKEPYKGLPALVPLDTNEGWYVATNPAGAGIQAFEASGRVVSFSLCNVGPNGLAEFFSSSKNDDICEQFNIDKISELPPFDYCVSKTKLTELVSRAQQYIYKVASAYKSGITSISLPSIGNVKVTAAPVLNPGIECEDFMSASDCNLMFNLCDPVLCPSSRCDFGGRYAVSDVVQTGIIGGIMLCLPNFGTPSEGGVLVPVCLSGIHAGLENLVMILNATRDCLQEQLKSGRTVGICDEIQSVYLCEFFWKQAIPLMRIGIPQLMQAVFEGKNKGGGEYLTVQESWNNLEQSLNYFTNYYGANAFKAFQARSTEEVGSEVCKAFVSANYPTSADFFDKLTEPESPTQFYAKFSETVLTDATIPATSQYKVYVWIYAGKDKGVYYNVYLKGTSAPATAYYQSLGNIQVPGAVGFIPQGEKIDRAVDFTAPAGYKELCVRIDNTEKCGFTQVTTDFALDELKNLYLEEQATEEITKEEECVSGTSSLIPLASLNIQQGVEEAINPAIYKHGIIRVCATEEPGISTEPGRWVAVGYCTDRNIRCWLDTQSVNQSISDLGIAQRALDSAKSLVEKIDVEGLLNGTEGKEAIYDTEEATKKALKEIDNLIESSDGKNARELESEIDKKIEPIIQDYRETISKSLTNENKVIASLNIAQLYEDITRKLYKKFFEKQTVEGGEEVLPDGSKAGDVLTKDKTNVGEEINIISIKGINALGEGITTKKCYYREDDGTWREVEQKICEAEKQPDTTEYYDINLDENDEGTNEINEGESISVLLDGKSHEIKLELLSVESGLFGLASTTSIDLMIDSKSLTLSATGTQKKDAVLQDMFTWTGISRDIDLNNDKKNDVTLTITSVSLVNKNIGVTLKKKIDKSLLENIKDFFVPEAEAAEIIPDDWVEEGYNSQDFTDAQKEASYSQRKNVYLLINQYAKQYNVNFNLVRAIVEKESNWNADEVTKTKETSGTANGYMGLTKLAIEDMATGSCKNFCGFRTINRNNADQNIRGGICYYACQYERFNNVNLAIAAYNQGPSYVEDYCKKGINGCTNPFLSKKGDEAKYYVMSVIENYQSIKLKSETASKNKNKPIIVIDPGHGGTLSGAVNSEGIMEKDMNLQIAKKLKEVFESQGYFVTLTRDSDKDVSLALRVKIANDLKADFFISIHMNSAKLDVNGMYCSATGTETFYYDSPISEKSKFLAEIVQKDVVAVLETTDRGTKKDTESAEGSLYVLRNTNMPAVLVEPGFICNSQDVQKLAGDSNKMQLATAISQAVNSYLA